ncbi:death-associated inhibitor of apoptosis 1-like isoform X1 [Macrobrachium rosenbergii]|uniref:death-associated inhibitor of apoptosis 1-like isoform X1 n=1 Tax=Macrobrachium rosenbergii TaxID=79674 RepID=UPI0034D6AFCA
MEKAKDDRVERRFFIPQCLTMEKVRLATFVDWKVDFIKPRDLSACMLYSQREEDHTRCFSCMIFVGKWEEGDIPWEEHKKHSPDCFFMDEPHLHGNVPIMDDKCKLGDQLFEEWTRGIEKQGAPAKDSAEEEKKVEAFKFINSYYDFLISRTLPKPPGNILRTEAIKVLEVKRPAFPSYSSLSSRKESFKSWPKEIDITPDAMAEAGFFSIDLVDWVQCFNCGGGLFAWRSGDNPLHDHARFYSFCPFIKEKLGEETVAKIAAENPPPLAPDRPVQLSEEEAELLLALPVCKKIFGMKMDRDLIATVMKLRVEECGFPFKNWRIFTDKIGDYLDSLDLPEDKNRAARKGTK